MRRLLGIRGLSLSQMFQQATKYREKTSASITYNSWRNRKEESGNEIQKQDCVNTTNDYIIPWSLSLFENKKCTTELIVD